MTIEYIVLQQQGNIEDDTVNGMPETAPFDAVLSRSLIVVGLGVTCNKAYARPVYCHL